MSERVSIDQLVDMAVLPVHIAVLAALASAEPLTDADITRAAVTATVTYLVECGLVTPCLDSEVPDLLPMRVGQPPASLQGDLRALLDLPDGPGDGGEW